MFELFHFLTTMALSLLVGNLLFTAYQLLIKRLADTFGKDLREDTSGLFETGLLVIGLIDVLGSGALPLGMVLCIMALVLDSMMRLTGCYLAKRIRKRERNGVFKN